MLEQKKRYYLQDAFNIVEPEAKAGHWNENLKFLIAKASISFSTGPQKATADEMQKIYDECIGSPADRKDLNLSGDTLKDFDNCVATEWHVDTEEKTNPLIDPKVVREVWPIDPSSKTQKRYITRPAHVMCYQGLWEQAVNEIKSMIIPLWNNVMSSKANAPTHDQKVLDFVKDWGPKILGEARYRDAAAHSGHFNHLSTFNNHYEPYPHRYQVGDYDRDEHTESRQSYANANAIAFDNSAHYDHLVYGDEYAEQRSLGGYMPMYGYEHVHPLVQPQLSTSNGNDSMQYGLMIIGLALFIFLMLCVTFTVLSGVCFAIGRVSNARKSDKIPYEVIEELTV
eukprot:246580_1